MNIIKKAAQVSQLCDGKAPLRFDTTLKVSPLFWNAWGINYHKIFGIKGKRIEEARINGYKREWEESTPERLDMIVKTSEQLDLGDSNNLMNRKMAEEIVKWVPGLVPEGKELVILDIGCGSGATTIALLEELKKSGMEYKIESYLLDPSVENLVIAEESVEAFLGFGKANILYGLIEKFLERDELIDILKKVNIILSNASLHHMSIFKVLHEFSRTLSRNVLFGFGDWCHGMLKNPGNCRFLIKELDEIEPGILAEYDRLFHIVNGKRDHYFEISAKSPEELNATGTMIKWWTTLAKNFRKENLDPFFSCFEGHMPWNEWEHLFTEFKFRLLSGPHYTIPGNSINTVALLDNQD